MTRLSLNSEYGFAVPLFIKLGLVFVVLFMALGYTFGTVVPPGYMGVRQVTLQLPFGMKQGFSDKGLAPGYHWSIPFYTKIHLVPSALQLLHVHREHEGDALSEGALEVHTTDGSSVLVDVSIMGRFYDQPGVVEISGSPLMVNGQPVNHGGPGELIRQLGPYKDSWGKTVLRESVDELRRALGSLTTSEFYDPHKREKQIKIATSEVDRKLAPWGIRVEAILLRRYTYTEQSIDQSIFNKNLQEAEERLNAAASRLADAKASLEQVAAEMDAQITTLRVEKENESRVVKSRGDLYEAEKKGEGDLKVAKALAEVDRAKATVLSDSEGAQAFVAREMAPLLNSLSGGVVTDLDPYDIQKWMERFGVDAKKSAEPVRE